MRGKHHFWLGICALSVTLMGVAAGQEGKVGGKATVDATFWGALIYASTGSVETPVAAGLADKLGKAFDDYESFELLGQHTQGVVFRDYVNWIVPSDTINLELESKGPAEGGGMKVLLKLWQKKKVLVKTDATLKPGSPLFISGPKWREGRLIFVLELRE